MGLFKGARDAMQNAGGMAGNAQAMAASQVADLQAGLTEGSFDPNDPAFAPIEGVDLDGYAKAVAAITKSGASNEAEAAKVAEGQGIPAGKWKTVSDGWVARMRESRAVMNRYGVIYGKY
ncbi:MAG TPA: hypothetical protein VN180_01380 [Acidimicrobiia bacterium]|nr:hypothetical protein [Acidimicrobiia bacterium]